MADILPIEPKGDKKEYKFIFVTSLQPQTRSKVAQSFVGRCEVNLELDNDKQAIDEAQVFIELYNMVPMVTVFSIGIYRKQLIPETLEMGWFQFEDIKNEELLAKLRPPKTDPLVTEAQAKQN